MSAPAIVVLYGGTFDPVHAGHLAVARAAAALLDAPVWLLPAADPPHRAVPGADARQRAQMLDLAVTDQPRLRVDRRELRRRERDPATPSWSVDTLAEVRAETGPHTPIVWLLGADAFRGLPSWRRWPELFDLAHWLIAVRPGHRLDALPATLAAACAGRWVDDPEALRAAPAGRLLQLEMPLRVESATALRQRIGAGRPWRGEVPAAVADYIVAQHLYSTAAT